MTTKNDFAARALPAVAGDGGEPAEPLVRLRQATARWVERERTRPRCPTGVAALDALLEGGWPSGKVAELVARPASGATGLAMATLAAATGRGEVVGWVDLADAFDPASARAAGVDLERVLWVRPRRLEEAVRASELVLEAFGFTVVVMDVGGAAVRAGAARGRAAERRSALRLRLARSVERAGAVVVVLAERPWVGTMAGVTLSLGPADARWRGGAGGPRWLERLDLDARVERGGRSAERRTWRVVGERAAGE